MSENFVLSCGDSACINFGDYEEEAVYQLAWSCDPLKPGSLGGLT